MKSLEELIKIAEETGLSKSELARITGLSTPTIRQFLQGGDIRVSTLEKIDAVLNPSTGGNNLRDINGNSNVINQTHGAPAPRIQLLSNSEKLELVELRVKVDYINRLLAEKDELISQLKERIVELTSKYSNGTNKA